MLGFYCVDFKRSPVRVSPSRWLKKFAGIAALFLSLAVCIADPSDAQSIAPFKRLAGQWSGSGTIDLTDGKREPIRCRASYDVLGDQRNLQLNIRCASDSYNFDLRASATYSAGSVSGTWSESTRLVAGTISGRADADHINVVAKAASFSASLSLTTHGARQSVVIRAHSADAGIKGVSMNLRRRG
ncbi:MAG TPA: hypothetical protein VFN63_14885 [Pseudolabrys sp.]|jgi:hypothetical protein|nr:hypothetical protein [Pseudolabrys sp.]